MSWSLSTEHRIQVEFKQQRGSIMSSSPSFYHVGYREIKSRYQAHWQPPLPNIAASLRHKMWFLCAHLSCVMEMCVYVPVWVRLCGQFATSSE